MEIENIIDNLPPLNEDGVQRIKSIVNEVAPLDADILGNQQVETIIRGGKFGDVKGGRHLDFVTTIGIIGSIATISQCTIEAINWSKTKLKGENKITPEMESLIKERLITAFNKKENLKQLIEDQPDLIEEILSLVNNKS